MGYQKLIALVALLPLLGSCEQNENTGVERWAATHDKNIKIDWDKVGEAYKKADGPQDFELKVNEIYEGSQLISVSVLDEDDNTQVVTGFFDRNNSGAVDEGEKIFSIRRVIDGEGSGNYRVQGHGYYHGYHSPMYSIASGMILGSMLSRAFSPGYRPMYSRPYVTSSARRAGIRSHRSSYRAKNPSRFASSKRGRSGRRYGSSSSRRRAPRRRAPRRGFRFGTKRRQRRRVRVES